MCEIIFFAMQNETFNLSKFLSAAGVSSRRNAAELVKSGKVSVNGAVVTNPGFRVSEEDRVLCSGKPVKLEQKKYYIMLNKPRGYVCTSKDIHAARKAVDLIDIPERPRLFSAGRLDKNSEGLILFSNDGDFVNRLTHPRNRIVKTYEVSVEKTLSEENIRSFLKGIEDDGEILQALKIVPLAPLKYKFILGEGKNREIRRMIDSVGNDTRRLKRIAVGKLRLSALKSGEWRHLTPQEIEAALQPVAE